MYELYDVKKDPHQMKNLSKNPEYHEVMRKLKADLMETLRKTNDPRIDNNGKYFEDMAAKKK